MNPDLPMPTFEVAVRMASALVHADEFLSGDGHPFDRDAFKSLVDSGEVQDYLEELRSKALLPVTRS